MRLTAGRRTFLSTFHVFLMILLHLRCYLMKNGMKAPVSHGLSWNITSSRLLLLGLLMLLSLPLMMTLKRTPTELKAVRKTMMLRMLKPLILSDLLGM